MLSQKVSSSFKTKRKNWTAEAVLFSQSFMKQSIPASLRLNEMACSLFGDIFANRGYLRPRLDLSQWKDDRIVWTIFASTDILKMSSRITCINSV